MNVHVYPALWVSRYRKWTGGWVGWRSRRSGGSFLKLRPTKSPALYARGKWKTRTGRFYYFYSLQRDFGILYWISTRVFAWDLSRFESVILEQGVTPWHEIYSDVLISGDMFCQATQYEYFILNVNTAAENSPAPC